MASFFEDMRGYNGSLIAKFTNSWKTGHVFINTMKFEVTNQLIAELLVWLMKGERW